LLDEGERATWPQIERIRIQTRISRTLDPILKSFEELHLERYGKPIRRTAGRAKLARRKAS